MGVDILPNHVKFYVSLVWLFVLYLFTVVAHIITTGIEPRFTMDGISVANIIKFNGFKNFGLWQRRIKDLLLQKGLVKALSRKKYWKG